MLDIGWWELAVIGMVALIVVGPKELPTLLRTIGRYVGMAKRQADEFRNQFSDALRETEFDDIRKEMNDLKSGMSSSFEDAQRSLNTSVDDKDDVRDRYPELDDDEPIKPASEFAGQDDTTSFTTADGEVITKRQDDDARRGNDPVAAADAGKSQEPRTQEPDPPKPGSNDTPTSDEATDGPPPRNAEAVR